MLKVWREHLKAIGQNRARKRFLVRYFERQLAQAQLDGDLPSRGVTDPLAIGFVFNRVSRHCAEMMLPSRNQSSA